MLTANGMPSKVPNEILGHLPFLKRIAVLQLGEDGNDVAQEVLIAAVNSFESYSGRVPIRAWLLGILRYKVIDAIRQKKRNYSISLDDDLLEGMFTENGSWNVNTFETAICPSETISRQQLLDVVELCIQALPEQNSRIFLLREYIGFDIEEIAEQFQMKQSHIRVILHRSRLKLRACAVKAWGDEYEY